MRNCAVLIPSLEPDARLADYVRTLAGNGLRVVVVNDGSGAEYDAVFAAVAGIEGCEVISHDHNRGKGAALKTGCAHIKRIMPGAGIVTADSDGQHAAEDVVALADRLSDAEEALYLGARDFDLPDIPKKSRYGNKITSSVFRLLYGAKLKDTQTGLRAFPASLIDFMTSVPGDRFEYEMNVLSRCALRKIRIISVPIRTIYENGENATSHFRAVRDSFRIYACLLSYFIKYAISSASSMLLDNLLFYLFDMLAWRLMPTAVDFLGMTIQILIATSISRALSATYNFTVNKKLVFGVKKSRRSALRYAILCVSALAVSALIVSQLNRLFGLAKDDELSRVFIKMPTDFLIFVFNYKIQRAWVFAPKD